MFGEFASLFPLFALFASLSGGILGERLVGGSGWGGSLSDVAFSFCVVSATSGSIAG